MRISDWSSDVCSSDLRVPTVFVEFDDNDGPSFTLDPSIPLSSENVSLRNSINQNFSAREGSLFQARLDSEYEFDGILNKLRGGLRYAKRDRSGERRVGKEGVSTCRSGGSRYH